MSKEDTFYKVHGAMSESAICTCRYAEKGNICKHPIKIIMLKQNSNASVKTECAEFCKETFSSAYNTQVLLVEDHRKEIDDTIQDNDRRCLLSNHMEIRYADECNSMIGRDNKFLMVKTLVEELYTFVQNDESYIDDVLDKMKKMVTQIKALHFSLIASVRFIKVEDVS